MFGWLQRLFKSEASESLELTEEETKRKSDDGTSTLFGIVPNQTNDECSASDGGSDGGGGGGGGGGDGGGE